MWYSKLFFSKMRITRIVGIKLKTKIIYFLWALLTVDFLILKPIFISKSRNHKYLHWEVSVSKNASENNLYKAYINSQTNLWMVVTRDIWFKSLNKKGKKRIHQHNVMRNARWHVRNNNAGQVGICCYWNWWVIFLPLKNCFCSSRKNNSVSVIIFPDQ